MLYILKESPGTSHTDMRKNLDIDTLEKKTQTTKRKIHTKSTQKQSTTN